MNQERTHEQPHAKEFGLKVTEVDRTRGHVCIEYGGRNYKWFLREDGRTVLLLNEDEGSLSDELTTAMKNQVRAILTPEL